MSVAGPRSVEPSDGRRGAMGDLDHDQLVEAQRETLAATRRSYSLGARILFVSLDVIYGKSRTLSKFKVLELVARVPYQSWEQVAYIAITHTHERTNLARRIHERVTESRSQQDNEQRCHANIVCPRDVGRASLRNAGRAETPRTTIKGELHEQRRPGTRRAR